MEVNGNNKNVTNHVHDEIVPDAPDKVLLDSNPTDYKSKFIVENKSTSLILIEEESHHSINTQPEVEPSKILREKLLSNLDELHIQKNRELQKSHAINRKLVEYYRKQKKHSVFIDDDAEMQQTIHAKYQESLMELHNVNKKKFHKKPKKS